MLRYGTSMGHNATNTTHTIPHTHTCTRGVGPTLWEIPRQSLPKRHKAH